MQKYLYNHVTKYIHEEPINPKDVIKKDSTTTTKSSLNKTPK